ncbi:MAG: Uma2 family endonuclease [Candidatus Rokubacteria bacterium]|nr:Uma2 family endonuclease [Candidatus Rokubacteria bacterium]
MAVQVERARRFTADEFERMVAAAIFRSDERLELIRGEIVEMSPISHRHSACVANLTKRLVTGVGDRAVVWIQGPARLAADSVPEPDLALLRPRSYVTCAPRPGDTLLVIEVAETSLRYDRTDKLRLYAGAGVPEYWVVSVGDGWIEVYRSPQGDGYREHRRAEGGESVAPLAFPDVAVTVADVFA